MSNITNNSPVVTEEKLTEFYEDIKPFLGCPAYVTQEGDAEYYSTDEKVVGRWTDNKPLYQRVFVGTTPNDSNWTDLITITNGNIVTAYLWVQTNDNPDVPNITLVSSSSQFFLQKTKLAFRGDIEGIRNKPYYVIVKYTKSTDSAATTVEQKPTHYSTDEQVVGTWIDGKPVYQRTWELTNVTVGANTETDITVDDSTNIKKIINAYGTYGDNDPFPFYSSDLSVRAMNKKTINQFAIRCTRSGSAFTTNFTVTFQYTKTTD